MRISVAAVLLVLASGSFVANASDSQKIAVFATAGHQGSVSEGVHSYYTKTFDVSLALLSGDSISLSKYCLKAYSPDNREFNLDTVDATLTSGILKKGESVKGFATFTSDSADVLSAAMVKITDCK